MIKEPTKDRLLSIIVMHMIIWFCLSVNIVSQSSSESPDPLISEYMEPKEFVSEFWTAGRKVSMPDHGTYKFGSRENATEEGAVAEEDY